MERRGVLEFIGGVGFGTLVGYYVGAKELLGIQSQRSSPTSAGSGSTPERTETPGDDGNTAEDTRTRDDGTTPPDDDTSPDGGFLYTFEDGAQEWTFGKRRDEDATEGTGSWSERYDGSLRLRVDGAPETIMAWTDVGSLSEGTTITANYAPERFEYNSASLFLNAVIPGEGSVVGDRDSDLGDNPEQDGTLEIEIPRDLPSETQIEFKLVIWPGETTVWIQDVGSMTDS